MISVIASLAVKALEKILIESDPEIEEFLISEIQKASQILMGLVEKKMNSNHPSQGQQNEAS